MSNIYDLYRKRVILIGGPAAGRMVILDGKMMNYVVEEPGSMTVGAKGPAKRHEYWVTTSPFDWDDEGPIFVATTETPGKRNVRKTLLEEYVRLAAKEHGK
jgi:hypothetical protein